MRISVKQFFRQRIVQTLGRSLLLLGFFALGATVRGDTILTMPFENVSNRPEHNWIGESFPVLMTDLLEIPGIVAIGPDERNVAFDRLGIPLGALLTRASAIKIAEKANADLLLLGSYTVEGEGPAASIAITARLIDVREGRLLGSEFQRGGLLTDLQQIQGELAWTILYQRNSALPYSRDQIVKRATSVPVDAFEDYVKAALTPDRSDKVLFLRRAVKTAQNNYPAAAFELGRNFYLLADYEEAIKWLSEIKADDPHYIEALFYLAVSQSHAGKLNDALANFNGLMPKLPLYEIYNNAGATHLKKGQVKEALPLLKSAAEVAARDADVQFNYGYALWLAQDYAGTVAPLERAIARRQLDNQHDGEAYYLLAKSQQQLGQTTAAAATLDQAKKHLSSFAIWETKKKIPNLARLKGLFNKRAYYQLERNARAEAATTRPATTTEELLSRAYERFRANQDEQALGELGKILQLAPDTAEAHFLIGRIYERQGRYPDAINALKAAVFWNPKLTAAYVLLGRIHLLQKECGQAKDYWQKALAVNAQDAEAQALGRTLATACGSQ